MTLQLYSNFYKNVTMHNTFGEIVAFCNTCFLFVLLYRVCIMYLIMICLVFFFFFGNFLSTFIYIYIYIYISNLWLSFLVFKYFVQDKKDYSIPWVVRSLCNNDSQWCSLMHSKYMKILIKVST